MKRLFLLVVALCLICLQIGCQNHPATTGKLLLGPDAINRNQGYALLYDTVNQESQVDKILILKGPSKPVADVLTQIARFSLDAKKQIDTFAKNDASLHLSQDGLPLTEVTTRQGISSDTTRKVLFNNGKAFEFQILLAQHQALNYITHMATTLSRLDTDKDRKAYLLELAQDSQALHESVITLLQDAYVK